MECIQLPDAEHKKTNSFLVQAPNGLGSYQVSEIEAGENHQEANELVDLAG